MGEGQLAHPGHLAEWFCRKVGEIEAIIAKFFWNDRLIHYARCCKQTRRNLVPNEFETNVDARNNIGNILYGNIHLSERREVPLWVLVLWGLVLSKKFCLLSNLLSLMHHKNYWECSPHARKRCRYLHRRMVTRCWSPNMCIKYWLYMEQYYLASQECDLNHCNDRGWDKEKDLLSLTPVILKNMEQYRNYIIMIMDIIEIVSYMAKLMWYLSYLILY